MATKVSEITNTELAAYIRLDDASSSELGQLDDMLAAAVQFMKSQTGLDSAEIDEKADLAIAAKVLVQDMYDNRTLYVDTDNVNKTVDAILGQYRQNFIPEELWPTTDNYTGKQNTVLRINPLKNDGAQFGSTITEIDGNAIAAGETVEASDVSVLLASTGILTVTPGADFVGVTTFSYKAAQPDGTTFASSVVIDFKESE